MQLRQTYLWSSLTSSWREHLLVLAFALTAGGLVYLGLEYLALWQSAFLWGVYGLSLAVCTRQGWLKLFGPVLFYDMIRSARRSRHVVMRLLYAGLLLFILCFLYLNLEVNRRNNNHSMSFFTIVGFFAFLLFEVGLGGLLSLVQSPRGRLVIVMLILAGVLFFIIAIMVFDYSGGERMQASETARLAELFFSVFMLVQLAIVILLTPAYVAGAIAEEKDRKTLEFLLATDLENREIVLSKLLSRVANMILLLLTGLPILSLLQFLGGVDQQLMLVGFAMTGLTMLGTASISILFSTLMKKPRDAIGMTYLSLIAYIGMGTVAWGMGVSRAPFMSEPIWFGANPPTLKDAANVLNTGNPLVTTIHVGMAIEGRNFTGGRTNLATELPGLLTRYTLFHLPLSLICIVWSIARVRAIALKQSAGGTTARLPWWQRYRPPVEEMPVLWKELHIEGGMKMNWLGILVLFALLLLTLGTGLSVLGEYIWTQYFLHGNRWNSLSESMNIWFRFAGTSVVCLTILSVGVRASTSISHERERDTFDALIATPLTSEEILAAKLIGSLTSLRMGGIWIGLMVALALFTGGLHWCAVPIILTAWFVYAVFFALVGTWFSMVAKSSMRATVYTVLTTLGLGGGHWLLTLLCCLPIYSFLSLDHHRGSFPEYLLKFQAGMTPPFVIGWCSYSWEQLSGHWGPSGEMGELIGFSILGVFLWGIACLVLWSAILVPKFKQITRREELMYQ